MRTPTAFCYCWHKNSFRNALCILTGLCTTGPQSPGDPRTATTKTLMSTKTPHTILSNDQHHKLAHIHSHHSAVPKTVPSIKGHINLLLQKWDTIKQYWKWCQKPSLRISFSISKKENVTYFITWLNILWRKALHEQSCRILTSGKPKIIKIWNEKIIFCDILYKTAVLLKFWTVTKYYCRKGKHHVSVHYRSTLCSTIVQDMSEFSL